MMNMTHRIAAPGLIAATMLALTASGFGQASTNNQSRPHFAGQAPGKAQEILRKFEGPVSAVDTNAMTLTIKLAEKPRLFKVTSKTRFIHSDNTRGAFNDASVGQKVEIITTMVHGEFDEVIAVNLKAE
jgi:hypothetical protein